jgi:hypothetical protein
LLPGVGELVGDGAERQQLALAELPRRERVPHGGLPALVDDSGDLGQPGVVNRRRDIPLWEHAGTFSNRNPVAFAPPRVVLARPHRRASSRRLRGLLGPSTTRARLTGADMRTSTPMTGTSMPMPCISMPMAGTSMPPVTKSSPV